MKTHDEAANATQAPSPAALAALAAPGALLLALALLLLLAERVHELRVARRHTAALVAKGARVVADDGYGAIVAVHVAFFPVLAAEFALAPWAGLGWWTAPFLALAVLAETFRQWAVRTLGTRWTTRVVVLPGEAPVTGGPFAYLRHPNYVAVWLLLVLVPLAFGALATAALMAAANGAALARRIRREEDAWRVALPPEARV